MVGGVVFSLYMVLHPQWNKHFIEPIYAVHLNTLQSLLINYLRHKVVVHNKMGMAKQHQSDIRWKEVLASPLVGAAVVLPRS